MSAMTNALEDDFLDHFLGTSAHTFIAQLYLGLYTASPADAGAHTNEASGGAYARQAIDFSASSSGSASNSAQIDFPQATASWGTLSHLGLNDGSTGGAGNMVFHGAWDSGGKAIATDDIFRLPASNLTVTAD